MPKLISARQSRLSVSNHVAASSGYVEILLRPAEIPAEAGGGYRTDTCWWKRCRGVSDWGREESLLSGGYPTLPRLAFTF